MKNPARGEIWYADFEPIRGHEQGGSRPCVIMSSNLFNRSFLGLVVVVPITSKKKDFPSHVSISPQGSGLKLASFIQCENLRSISKERLSRPIGTVPLSTLREIEDRLKIILNF